MNKINDLARSLATVATVIGDSADAQNIGLLGHLVTRQDHVTFRLLFSSKSATGRNCYHLFRVRYYVSNDIRRTLHVQGGRM